MKGVRRHRTLSTVSKCQTVSSAPSWTNTLVPAEHLTQTPRTQNTPPTSNQSGCRRKGCLASMQALITTVSLETCSLRGPGLCWLHGDGAGRYCPTHPHHTQQVPSRDPWETQVLGKEISGPWSRWPWSCCWPSLCPACNPICHLLLKLCSQNLGCEVPGCFRCDPFPGGLPVNEGFSD